MRLIQLMKKWFGKEEEEDYDDPPIPDEPPQPIIPEGTTRIVHNVQVNGKENFIPEVYKYMWAGGRQYGDYVSLGKYTDSYTLKEAQDIIDRHIEMEARIAKIQYENSIKYTEHLQYP